LLDQRDLSFSVLRPLIFETAHKVMSISPKDAQTGPARRGDEDILAIHRQQLKSIDQEMLPLYTLLSDLIKRETTERKVVEEETRETKAGDMLTLW
ncbi:MAG: DUF2520 domain-containing protein, partial [Odoribacteraceae bacterium]|jgi:predicted short-subunit dehydrogenase-like oxidoreductase (DUF2520 family)|nr:DUF2520 domain-containing protein [Odoribacteraceae bacterium]